ncbi:MAG: L,D-transpeptidase family protein [Candidatus Yonathbacteria bacterium]|nr:L,D-transpeptidase family protein [Candidatus Yonathbacteria bacterium]
MIDRHTRNLIIIAFGAFFLAIGAIVALQKLTYAGKPPVSIMYPDGSGTFGYGAFPALSRPDFFNEVRGKLIESGETFIEADLSGMSMRVYKNGKVALEVPIKTKGKEGSWWETPAGLYRIETKEKDHFSSFGKVHQPWSMSFQGNFFIHGWPYYPDGIPVSSTYSGGCIRLADNDAKAVYDTVSVGTPILVFEKDFASDGFEYQALPPTISAPAYLIGDLNNNDILLEKGGEIVLPVGSVTKLMTALVAGEYINMDGQISVPASALVSTKIPRLREGESHKAFHVLYLLLLESSNEAAEVFASVRGKNNFVAYMNKKALALGMEHTVFVEPEGTDVGDISTVRDLFALARYTYHNRSFAFDIVSGKANTTTYGETPFERVTNINIGAKEVTYLGGISGNAPDGKGVAIATFEITHQGQKRPIVFAVLGSSDVVSDISALRDYMARMYR